MAPKSKEGRQAAPLGEAVGYGQSMADMPWHGMWQNEGTTVARRFLVTTGFVVPVKLKLEATLHRCRQTSNSK
jgi:hypothetical protein